MEPYRISAKNLGELALENVCPRCFWLKRRFSKMPYSIFPGIFSTIDSYTKKITHAHYDRTGELLPWFAELGIQGAPVKAPSASKFQVTDPESGITLTGTPDEVIALTGGGHVILDYKTARFSPEQEKLLPLYAVQLNVYAWIGERMGYNPIRGLYLVYYEPSNAVDAANIPDYLLPDGFNLSFHPHVEPVEHAPGILPPLLRQARAILDQPVPPQSRAGCSDCAILDEMTDILHP